MGRYAQLTLVKEKAAEIRTGQDREWGPVLVFRALWDKVGIGSIVRDLAGRTGIEFDVDAALFAMALNRLTDPCSKLEVNRWTDTVYCPSFDGLELQHLYRALDFLAGHKDMVEERLFF